MSVHVCVSMITPVHTGSTLTEARQAASWQVERGTCLPGHVEIDISCKGFRQRFKAPKETLPEAWSYHGRYLRKVTVIMPPNSKQVEKLKKALRRTQEVVLRERAIRSLIETRCAAFGEEAVAAASWARAACEESHVLYQQQLRLEAELDMLRVIATSSCSSSKFVSDCQESVSPRKGLLCSSQYCFAGCKVHRTEARSEFMEGPLLDERNSHSSLLDKPAMMASIAAPDLHKLWARKACSNSWPLSPCHRGQPIGVLQVAWAALSNQHLCHAPGEHVRICHYSDTNLLREGSSLSQHHPHLPLVPTEQGRSCSSEGTCAGPCTFHQWQMRNQTASLPNRKGEPLDDLPRGVGAPATPLGATHLKTAAHHDPRHLQSALCETPIRMAWPCCCLLQHQQRLQTADHLHCLTLSGRSSPWSFGLGMATLKSRCKHYMLVLLFSSKTCGPRRFPRTDTLVVLGMNPDLEADRSRTRRISRLQAKSGTLRLLRDPRSAVTGSRYLPSVMGSTLQLKATPADREAPSSAVKVDISQRDTTMVHVTGRYPLMSPEINPRPLGRASIQDGCLAMANQPSCMDEAGSKNPEMGVESPLKRFFAGHLEIARHTRGR
eukprot:jgi/Botrbrau1/19726/Bobra.0003s0086.1